MMPTTDKERRQQQIILNLEKELNTRFEAYREDRQALASIRVVMDEFVHGAHINTDATATESMKKIESVINGWCRPDYFEGIDYVNIKIAAAEHTTVLITYPAYTIGNKNAMEYAIAGIVSKLRRG